MNQFFTKINFSFSFIILMMATSFAQSQNSLWTKTNSVKASTIEKVFRKTEPTAATFYQLDINALKNILRNAPLRGESDGLSKLIVEFPTVDNKLESFRVIEASVMHPELQAQFSNIRSYVGQSIDRPSDLIRFSITPQGLHTILLSSERGTQYIDPYTKTGNFYIVYAKSNIPSLEEPWICEFDDSDETAGRNSEFDLVAARNANDGMLRTYELALASTIEYSAFHINAAGVAGGTLDQKKAAVLAAMNITMTRVNGIYEKDLSLTMVIVPNNLSIIFVDSDNFDNNNAGTLVNQSQSVIDQIIGSPNYDIGHTFSTGAGGAATLNTPCVNGSKARGITGLPSPVGDAYDIDFVAHEMGHQYGSRHTFNGSTGNCADERSASDAYEPGSGSTIMAYAGICSPQNVQPNSDDYFHQRSLVTIWANISSGNSSSCPTKTPTGNSAPTAEAGPNYLIPILTPYKLTASSTDPNGIASHTFTWEQYDLGPAGIPTETTISGPLVRSFKGTANPTRFIPRLEDLILIPGSTIWEKLVSVARPINFRVTVRDNAAAGGQTAVDNMMATTVSGAGPFVVTSQSTDNISWAGNSNETITWNVAGTTGNGINTANVNILLSTDGGLTYPITLASNTPNDGSQIITVPNIQEPFCRVMVEAAGNIFFNINSKNFAVGVSVSTTCTSYSATPNVTITDNGRAFTQLSDINVPISSVITDVNIGVNITHPYIGDLIVAVLSPGGTEVRLMNPNDCDSEDNLIVKFDDNGTTFNCAATGGNQVYKSLQQPLSNWNGENTLGNWRMGVGDFGPADIGRFNSWFVEVCQTVVTPLSVEEFDADNFSLYPNPNSGTFTIKLKSLSGKDIKVKVYDIRGRFIFNNSYNNTSDIKQEINLNNVQSGMYLVNISDGDKQITKKIVIQ